MTAYQDLWAHGELLEKGQRECAARYEVVRNFCQRYDRPFSVCDIGANMSYFGIRLTEDFPGCTVVAFEFHQFAMREKHLKKSKADRVLLLNRKVGLNDLRLLGNVCQFDVVLAMSVAHHFNGPFGLWLSAMKRLGDNVIIEFAGEDSARVGKLTGYGVPADAIPLGCGDSHLSPFIKRPIVLIKGGR